MDIHNIPLPMLRLNAGGQIYAANLLAQDCLGMAESRLIDMHISTLFEPTDAIHGLLERAFVGGGIADHDLKHHESQIPYTLHVGADGDGLAVIMVPEGHRVELEQQTKHYEMAEAVARIALEMAHEVKNPLAALRGMTQWLSEQTLQSEQREATGMILAEVDRIRTRIDAFLQLGPRANVQMEYINIHTLIDDVCHPSDTLILTRTFDPSLPDMLAHPGRLRQAIENLWINALDAGARHVEWHTQIAPSVCLPQHDGAVLEVRITNDGTPIPEAVRDCLFEPYVTGKKRGSGLGLAIVQRVMLEHGGRVQVHTSMDTTSLILQLPLRSRK